MSYAAEQADRSAGQPLRERSMQWIEFATKNAPWIISSVAALAAAFSAFSAVIMCVIAVQNRNALRRERPRRFVRELRDAVRNYGRTHERVIIFYDRELPTNITHLANTDHDLSVRQGLIASAGRLHQSLLEAWQDSEGRAEDVKALLPELVESWERLHAKHLGLHAAMSALSSGFLASSGRKESREGLQWAEEDVRSVQGVLTEALAALDPVETLSVTTTRKQRRALRRGQDN
jgi:hypothetical protein